MKILLIGSKKNYNAEYFYAKAFKALGHDVYLEDQYSGINKPIIHRILHTRTSMFRSLLNNLYINKNIIKIANELNPDFILVFKGELLSNAVIEKLSTIYKTYIIKFQDL